MQTIQRGRGRVLGAAIACTITAQVLIAGGAGASGGRPAPAAGGNVSSAVAEAQAEAAESYWTAERLRDAKPAPMPTPRASGRSGAIEAEAGPSGAPASVPPGTATQPAEAAADEGTNEIEPLHASAVARPYTDLPDRLNGKVFFTKASDGLRYVCSGTIINSTSKRLVHTAGHCVSDGRGRYHLNWIFIPGYSSSYNGHEPYGRYSARVLTVRTEWHYYGNFKQDLGIAVMNDRNGVRIANALGSQGVAWNQSRYQVWNDYGYPQAYPFSGYTQHRCDSGRLADDNPSTRSGPLTIRIHCNMTGGSSGGGWLIRVSSGLGYLNSVNSYRYISGPLANSDHMYGPYFGSEAKSLYDYANALG